MLTQLPTKLLYGLAEASHHWATYHPHYKEKLGMTKSAHNPLLVRPPPKLLSRPGDWSNNVVKFGTHHLHYNDKVAANPTWTFGLYFLCNFGNLSTNSPISAGDNRACNTEPGLVTKKREPPKTFLYLLLGTLQLPSLMLSLTFSKIRLPIFEHLAMFKYTPISEWQFSLTLASFALLAENLSVKLTSKTSSNLSCPVKTIAQTVEILPDGNALSSKRLQQQITNKSRGLRHITGFNIEKRNWGRYKIMRKKSCQHQDYGKSRTGKHEIGKDGTDE